LNNEYDIDIQFKGNPVILDIGANIGAFAIWSLKRFNPDHVYCYEPLKQNFAQLQKNINNLPPISTKFTLINKAVEAPSTKLHLSTESPASVSFYEFNGYLEDFEEVETMKAEELPDCGVLKVDTEGCELDILTNYLKTPYRPTLILFEYHRDSDRTKIDSLLYSKDYKLCGGYVYGFGFGTVKYVNCHNITMPKNWLLRQGG
jgi:FkbM family methyltransferase